MAARLSKAGSAQKGRRRTGLSAMEGPLDPPIVQPWARQRTQAYEGRKLARALHVVLRTLLFLMVAQPGNWTVTKLIIFGASDGTVGT